LGRFLKRNLASNSCSSHLRIKIVRLAGWAGPHEAVRIAIIRGKLSKGSEAEASTRATDDGEGLEAGDAARLSLAASFVPKCSLGTR
jgi:hypothetical protein